MPSMRTTLYDALETERDAIDGEIEGLHWLSEPAGKRCHLEVRKAAHLTDTDNWTEDFSWLLAELLLFQRVLGPRMVRAAG